MFHLPSKSTLKEVKMTVLLVSLVVTHIILTVPSNITFLYWTLFPDAWVRKSNMTLCNIMLCPYTSYELIPQYLKPHFNGGLVK